MDPDRLIRKKWRIKPRDTLPFKGWSHEITREDLFEIYAELGYKEAAEIGVGTGRHAVQLVNHVPGLHLYAVDPWAQYGRCSQRICDKRYAATVKRLKDKNATILRKTSLEASQEFEDGSLDFVYIDGDHRFDAVMMDIILWAPKVRKGGIVAGHDYYHFYQSGVVDAVRAYTWAHRITEWYVTWEKEATWLWVVK